MYKKIILYIIIITLFLSVIFLYTGNKQLKEQNFAYKKAMFVYSYKYIIDSRLALLSVYEKFDDMSVTKIIRSLTRVNNMLLQVENNLELLRISYKQDTSFLSYIFYLYAVEMQDLIIQLDEDNLADKELIKNKLNTYMKDFDTISIIFQQNKRLLENASLNELKEFAQNLLSQLKTKEVITWYNEHFDL